MKVRAILTQQKCDEALKGVAVMSATLSYTENKSVTEQLSEFNKIIDDLTNIDVKIEDEDQTFHLLCALPKSLEHLKDALLYGKEGTHLG